MRLTFERVSGSVQLDDEDALLAPLPSIFRYWPYTESSDSAAGEPLITVRREGEGYLLHAPWREKPPRYSNPVNLACGLAVNLNRAMLEEHTSYLCLHGAGVEIGGRLVVLPNYYHAGKSALTACLAAAGARVFSDDILPLLPDSSGMALGVSPRLRLPLPEALGKRSLRFVDGRRGAENRQYLYVDLESHEQAAFGTTSRFGGFVLLDRRESGPAGLTPASDGMVLKQAVLRNFAQQVPAEASLDRLHGLVAASECYTLTYSNGDEAADLLMDRFADVESRVAGTPEPVRPDVADRSPQPVAQRAAGGRHPWRRAGISERLVGGDLFLVDGAGEAIFHLNQIGAGLWRLMDGTCDTDEAVAVLSQAFPEIDRAVIERDVTAITADLLYRGLLLGASGAKPGSDG